MPDEPIQIKGRVTNDKQFGVENATVHLCIDEAIVARAQTDMEGCYDIPAPDKSGEYVVRCTAFGTTTEARISVDAATRPPNNVHEAPIDLKLGLGLNFFNYTELDGRLIPTPYAVVERSIVARIDSLVEVEREIGGVKWQADEPARITTTGREAVIVFPRPGNPTITATIADKGGNGGAKAKVSGVIPVSGELRSVDVSGPVRVRMERKETAPTRDQALWSAIDERCAAIGFERYQEFIRRVFELPDGGSLPGEFSRKLGELGARGAGVYRMMEQLTQLFVITECGPISDRERSDTDLLPNDFRQKPQRTREEIEEGLRQYLHRGELPYIERVVKAAYPWLDLDGPGLEPLRRRMLRQPLCLELWHEMCLEHGMVMRTMDAISERFQNVYSSGENDGLASYEISPLRKFGVGDSLWDWINHEPTRLNPRRRIQEYQHQYGPIVLDRNVSSVRPADVRTAFPTAFMRLLSLCEVFYKEDGLTTYYPDTFQVAVALREVHQILAMGAGNAAPQLTFAARVETLMMQLMLSYSELRAFLHVREMVPYDEAWMASVDAMKDLQRWQEPSISISHHRDLAVYGERIIASIRLGDWTAGDETNSRNWLLHYRNAIKRFTFAYRAISGAELGAGNGWAATRAVLAGDGRPRVLTGRSQTRPELGFAESPGQFAPRLSKRGRLID